MHSFYLRSLYLRNELTRGELTLAGQRLALAEDYPAGPAQWRSSSHKRRGRGRRGPVENAGLAINAAGPPALLVGIAREQRWPSPLSGRPNAI